MSTHKNTFTENFIVFFQVVKLRFVVVVVHFFPLWFVILLECVLLMRSKVIFPCDRRNRKWSTITLLWLDSITFCFILFYLLRFFHQFYGTRTNINVQTNNFYYHFRPFFSFLPHTFFLSVSIYMCQERHRSSQLFVGYALWKNGWKTHGCCLGQCNKNLLSQAYFVTWWNMMNKTDKTSQWKMNDCSWYVENSERTYANGRVQKSAMVMLRRFFSVSFCTCIAFDSQSVLLDHRRHKCVVKRIEQVRIVL